MSALSISSGPGILTASKEFIGRPGPQRILTIVFFVNAVGTGLFMTASALYYTIYLGLSAEQVAIALGIGGIVGIFSGMPVGHIADRRGPRGTYVVTMLAEAASMLAFLWAADFLAFAVVTCLASLTMTAGVAARGPLIRGYASGTPTRFRAFLRTASGLGVGLGAVVAGVLVAIGSPTAYALVVILNALSFFACGLILLRVPPLPVVPRPEVATAWGAITDLRFVVFTISSAVLAANLIMLPFAIPLWIHDETAAPTWIVSVLMLINAVGAVLFQIAASRGVNSVRAAARAMRWAAAALAVTYALFGWSAYLSPAWATVILVAGALTLTAGELLHSVGAIELSFRLAPEHATGAYQGVFGMGKGVVLALAPAFLTWLLLGRGMIGWIVLAGITIAAALVVTLLASFGQHSESDIEG